MFSNVQYASNNISYRPVPSIYATFSQAETAALFGQKYAAYYNNGIEYHQLSSQHNEIRLLRIYPAAAKDDDIVCHLEHTLLDHPDDSRSNYVALSYNWGDGAGGKHVILAGNYVSVTSNLYRALLELRSRKHYLVWVDGLCINQTDLEERCQQVMMMAAIYRSASMVISYLDTHDPLDQSRSAMVSLLNHDTRSKPAEVKKSPESKGKDTKKGGNHGLNFFFNKKSTTTKTQQQETTKPSKAQVPEPQRKALLKFLEHEYWMRVWIVQEISVNPRLEIIWAGNVFDLNELTMTLRRLTHVDEIGKSQRRRHIEQLSSIRQSQLALQPLALIDALKMCHQAKASMHQDRVFALLGLTHDGPSLVPLPSYQAPMDKMCRDMTVRMIQATKRLDLIVTKSHEVESWYPDWFAPQSWATSSAKGPEGLPSMIKLDPIDRYYRASGKSRADFKPSAADLSISLKGLCIGQVTACSPTLKEAKASKLDNSHITVSRTWTEKQPDEVHPCAKDTTVTEALRWLLVDVTGNHGKDASNERKSFKLLWKLLHRRESLIREHAPDLIQWMNFCEKQDFKIEGEPFVSYFSKQNEKGSSPPRAFSRICRTIQWNLEAGMKLGSLSGGQLGWLHKNAKVGDKVVIFLGSATPCVVRSLPRNGKSFRIVGPSIINGVMNGEVLEDATKRQEYFHVV
ncbi:heterokaryon incompatibility protein-domain-containing protein [Xylaria scruposa]|nr:heterokaryon incompatibility protein-domain-containing protein [Xylaria scruposa]